MDQEPTPSVVTASLFSPFECSKPNTGFSQLEIGDHEILKFYFVRNRWYDGLPGSVRRILMIELQDQVLFLPANYAKKFNDSDKMLQAVNDDSTKRFIRFAGKNDAG